MKSLEQVKPGETVSVVRLHGEGPIKRRIMDMGITKGSARSRRSAIPWKSPCAATSCLCAKQTALPSKYSNIVFRYNSHRMQPALCGCLFLRHGLAEANN